MEKEFVPYELTLKLKELGFDGECLAFYIKIGEKMCLNMYTKNNRVFTDKILYVPLWQQAFDWFREKYKLHGWVVPYFTLVGINYSYLIMDENMRNLEDEVDVGTYQEARQACLENLIEIIENNKQ